VPNDGISVAWEAIDAAILALLSPAVGTTTYPDPTTAPAPGSAGTASTSISTSLTPTSPVAKTNGGLSTGAKAGIGVGVPLAFLALLGVFSIFLGGGRVERVLVLQ
jgi:hypothetical protein